MAVEEARAAHHGAVRRRTPAATGTLRPRPARWRRGGGDDAGGVGGVGGVGDFVDVTGDSDAGEEEEGEEEEAAADVDAGEEGTEDLHDAGGGRCACVVGGAGGLGRVRGAR